MSRHELTLREEILLLSLDDKQGSFLDSQLIPYVVAGALLMELDAMGRVGLEEGFLVPLDASPTGDDLLDEVLALMSAAPRRRRTPLWVRMIPGKIKKIHDRVAMRLVDRGILKESEGKVLGLFPVKRYPERTPVPERAIREQVRRAAAGSRRIDDHAGRLVALVAAGKLGKRVFPPDNRRERERRIKALVKSDAFGQIVGETAREIYSAVDKLVASGGRG